MIRYLAAPVRNFMGLILLAAITAGAASAHNGNPGPKSPPEVSSLIQQLKKPDLQDRRDAARKLGKIKPLPAQAIPALMDVLKTPPPYLDRPLEMYAVIALSGAGPRAVPPLAALANAGNESAVWALGRMAFSEPAAWPVLISLFKSDSSAIRSAAASGLAIAGPPVVPLLVKALADDDPRMRAGAAETILHMRLRPTNEIGVRYAKPEDLAPAAPQLAKLLSDPDVEVRDHAALALAYADPSDKRTAPILVQMLDRGASFEAIAALQNMGGSARGAVPALERVLAGNGYWLMGVNAAHALAKIGGAQACAQLAQAIVASKNDQAPGWVTDAANSINRVREGAADAIVEISPACPQTIPTLIATLGKPWSATSALTKLGTLAVPALAAASKSPNLAVRENAVQTLAAISPVSPAAVRALTLALRDESLDLDSRQAAVGALADLKPPTPVAVDGLMLALKDKSDTIRSTAANALQDLGGEAGRAARAELKREQLTEAQRSEPDTRSYSRDDIIATIQDPDLEFPLSLDYLVPILPLPAPIDGAPFVVTVHSAEDQHERLTVWKRTGVGRYQKIKVMDADPDSQEHFDVPITFQATAQVTTAGGHQSEEREFFVQIPVEWYRGGEERVFAVDAEGWHPVEIKSPEEAVPNPKQIPLKYQTPSRSPELGSYHQLDWSFLVSNEGDPMCCPSGGQVSGTYKIVKDCVASPPRWKMIIDTARFSGPSQAAEAAKKRAEISQLIGDTKSSNLQQRKDALEKLSKTEPLPPEAIQALAEAAKTLDPAEPLPTVTYTPGQGVGNAGPANHPMAGGISSGGQQTCEIAIYALGNAAKRDPTVWPILIDALKGCSSPKLAADQLAKIGPPVLPLLLNALKDKDPRVRAGAAEALGLMVKPPVAERYFDPDQPFGTPVGMASASAAGLAPAVSGLTEALQDPDPGVRNQAAIALALALPNNKRSVPILVQILEGADEALREAALAALDGMGESAKDAAPVAERMLETDTDRREAGEAARVLGSIAGAAACDPLARAIADSKDNFVRQSAIAAMGRLWSACPQTIPTLMGTFGGDDQVAFSSVRALRKIGKPAMPALAVALRSADPKTRQSAVEAFAGMNAALTPEAVDALTTALGDKNSEIRSDAAQSLHNAGGAAQQAARAEDKREEEAEAAAHPQAHIAPVPKFSKAQIIAPIPADATHNYPLKLALFAPISGYVVTLHTGKDRPERLVFWKVTDDKYQKVVLMESRSGEHFQVPTSFDAIVEYRPGESFVDVATLGRRGVTDRVLHIDDHEDQWQPVKIESPEDWYKDKLAPSETVRHPGRNFFSDGGLEFEFQIWNSNDQDCCPTAGQVTGTYKIIKARPSIAGASVELHDSATFHMAVGVPKAGTIGKDGQIHGERPRPGFFVVKPNPVPPWQMIVDTAKRQP